MPKFKKCPKAVQDLATIVLRKHETHKPLLDANVRIDFVFAFGDRDENDQIVGPAITHHGHPAAGVARKIPTKDRAKGMGDCEVLLDGDQWEEMTIKEREGLLDHELHHFAIVEGKVDSAGRPCLKMRKHDIEFGWFRLIAMRNGVVSPERIQAKALMDHESQYFWPTISGESGGSGRIANLELNKPGNERG